MRQGLRRIALILLSLLFLTSVSAFVVLAIPEGVDTVTIVDSQQRPGGGQVPVQAEGGNITIANIISKRRTTTWQGFAGNISASLTLDDTSNDTFYNWNVTNITGEIYASRNNSVAFATIKPVFADPCTTDEDLTGLTPTPDRTSRTFFFGQNTVNFTVGNVEINASSACTAFPFINGSRQFPATNLFENVILTTDLAGDAADLNGTTIYTGILPENGETAHGFDGLLYNFQIIVPVNESTGFETYFFYAEIE